MCNLFFKLFGGYCYIPSVHPCVCVVHGTQYIYIFFNDLVRRSVLTFVGEILLYKNDCYYYIMYSKHLSWRSIKGEGVGE